MAPSAGDMALGLGIACASGSPAQKPNLRTCGRTAPAVPAPHRTLLREAGQSKSMPSIPSRFEVTLFTGDREHKGFGSNTLRFDSVAREDVPGPGRYCQPKSGIDDKLQSVSWGIRGTGGFASRSTRFGLRSNPSAPRLGLGVPGPGKYDDQAAENRLREAKNFSKAKGSSAFADCDVKSRISAAAAMPGPGHYPTDTKVDAKAAAAAQAAFKSRSTRGVDTKESSEMPGPGEYHDGVPKSIATSLADASGAAFKHPSQPKIARIHKDLPAADARQRQVLGKYADEVGRECLGTVGTGSSMPGPGHYTQDRDVMWQGGLVGMAGSSSFMPGSKRTDFSHEELAHLPGPGRYNPHAAGGINLTSAASAFNSATHRDAQRVSEAPGPAYYAPGVQLGRKSFRMKAATRQWLS